MEVQWLNGMAHVEMDSRDRDYEFRKVIFQFLRYSSRLLSAVANQYDSPCPHPRSLLSAETDLLVGSKLRHLSSNATLNKLFIQALRSAKRLWHEGCK